MKGRLWQCDVAWNRIHSQDVEFSEWPQAGRVFSCVDSMRKSYELRKVEWHPPGARRVERFESNGTRFELEKL